MSSTELGLTNAVQRWRLRDICRRRLLEEMVSHARSHSEAPQIPTLPASADGKGHPDLVLVADAFTLRMVNSVCQIHDLNAESIWGVQCIDQGREPLPVLEALYFIAPTADNVEQLVRDVLDSGPKYRRFHIFFSHKLGDDQLQQMARSRGILGRVCSFAELNLSFFVHDDRSFHLGDRRTLAAILEDIPRAPESLAESACKLATFVASLPATPSILYASRSAGSRGGFPGICKQLASELRARLEEMGAKSVSWPHSRAGSCSVLIVDRGVDWIPLLAHDMHYEAMLYDALGSSSVNVEEGRFVYKDRAQEQEKTMVLGDARDGLWETCRHMPIWEVQDLLVRESKSWKQRDEEMRRRPSAGSVSQQVSKTLNVVQSLPEHKERFDKLQVHLNICNQCKTANESLPFDVVALEQDLATGVDQEGSRPSSKAVEQELRQRLQDPQLSGAVKARLLLLFLSSPEGAGCPEGRRQELVKCLPVEDRCLPLSKQWLAASRGESRAAAERRRDYFQEVVRDSDSSMNAQLCRWEPRLCRLIEELARGTADGSEFPVLRDAKAPPARATAPAAVAPQLRAVVVFIVGGITLPEVRAAHKASRALGIEAFVGGSCLLTPEALLSALRGL